MEHDVPLYPNPKVSAINSKISNYINSFSHRWNRRGNRQRSFRVTENRKRKKTKVSNFSQSKHSSHWKSRFHQFLYRAGSKPSDDGHVLVLGHLVWTAHKYFPLRPSNGTSHLDLRSRFHVHANRFCSVLIIRGLSTEHWDYLWSVWC